MLDEIVLSWTARASVGFQLPNHLQLVIAGKNEGLLLLLLVPLEMHEAGEDVEPAIALPDLLPEIGGLMAVWIGRVARTVVIALVKRQKERLIAFEFGGHKDAIRVDREVNQCALPEAEH